MEDYSIVERKKWQLYASTMMNLNNIVLSKKGSASDYVCESIQVQLKKNVLRKSVK